MTRGFLLDTQVLIWALIDPERIPLRWQRIIETEATHVSMAALWEIAIKQSLGKLELPKNYLAGLMQSRTGILDIRVPHLDRLATMPFHHRDPFDRMLIAQAQVEAFAILTTDHHFASYDVVLAKT